MTKSKVAKVEVNSGSNYVNITKSGNVFDQVNILIGSNTDNALSGKSSVYDYIFNEAHETLTIQIGVTYDIDGNLDTINDQLITIYVFELKKA